MTQIYMYIYVVPVISYKNINNHKLNLSPCFTMHDTMKEYNNLVQSPFH